MSRKKGRELRRRSELLWGDGERPSRGPKPGLSREDIVRAAIRIADRDGLAALTMQAVAKKLGFTTMALYRYFPSKEALVDAIVDAAMGRPPRGAEPNADWRGQLEHWAHAKRAMLTARPWLAELPFFAAPHGPNWLSWVDAAVEALSRAGLSAADMFEMVTVIVGYVREASNTAVSRARARAGGTSDEEWGAAIAADLGRAVGDPRFPALSAVLTSGSGGPAPTLEEGFDFGLQRVLDGIQVYLDSRPAYRKADGG